MKYTLKTQIKKSKNTNHNPNKKSKKIKNYI